MLVWALKCSRKKCSSYSTVVVQFIHRCSEAGVQPRTDVPYAGEIVPEYLLSHVLLSGCQAILNQCLYLIVGYITFDEAQY